MEAFRQQVPVMLCSESGGEGRNLQFANTLINYDLPWNPMKIEQRVGRIHRIGQTREVFIFNLCTAGSLEARLLDLLTDKIRMFELVVGEVGSILGNLEGGEEFETLVLNLWLRSHSDQELDQSFDDLGDRSWTPRRNTSRASSLTRRCSARITSEDRHGNSGGTSRALCHARSWSAEADWWIGRPGRRRHGRGAGGGGGGRGRPARWCGLTSSPASEGWCVSLATDFLETAGRLLEAEPRIGSFARGRRVPETRQLDEAVRRAFTWLNAKVRLADTRALPVEYHTWWFHAAIVGRPLGDAADGHDQRRNRGGGRSARPAGAGAAARAAASRPPESTYATPVARACRGCRRRPTNSSAAWTGGWRRPPAAARVYGALVREADHKKAPRRRATRSGEDRRREAGRGTGTAPQAGRTDERYAMEADAGAAGARAHEIPALAVDLRCIASGPANAHRILEPVVKAVRADALQPMRQRRFSRRSPTKRSSRCAQHVGA